MIAATEAVDLARLLLDLLIVLAAAKVGAEAAERCQVPAVLGEIVVGVLIGPSVLGLVQLSGERGVSVGVLAEIGVVLLLLQVGMEMDLGELGKVGRASLLVAVIGVVLPFVGGALAGVALGEEVKTAVFLGAALTATSVGITARVFGDLGALATTEARVVIGAAVADDVLGLVILTVVVKVVTGGSVGFASVLGTLGFAVGFLLVAGAVGWLVVPRLLNGVHRRASSNATVVVAALVVTLGFAELANAAKLAFIIGAFIAGISLARADQHERIAEDLGSLGTMFIPVFFVQIGVNADLHAMAKPSVLGLAAVLTCVGVAGKVAAALGAIGTRADKVLIGLGMIPRGEVGLIFASIGLASGVLNEDLYGALLVVVLSTTVLTPPLLRARIGAAGRRSVAEAPYAGQEPPGGWLDISDDEISLREPPPPTEILPLALYVASLLSDARPSDELLDWFGAHRTTPLVWDPDDTPALVRLLRTADYRAWRFLDLTGVLERSLPEVSRVMRQRRADVRVLDPLSALRFPVVDALHELQPDGPEHDADLLLAALATDVCASAPDGNQCAVDLATRLGRITDAERIAGIVADARLLRAGAGDPGVFDEHEILELATHFASPVAARQARTLALALGELPRWQLEALDERYRLVLEALDHPELTGSEASNMAHARMRAAQRLAVSPAIAERLRHSTTSYLLAHDPSELARQAQLIEPLPRSGIVRVAVSPAPEPDYWTIDVACRDASGLLARLAGVMRRADLDIASASIATWPDGAVLDVFNVRSLQRPRAKDLALAMEAALRARLPRVSMPDLELHFDNDSHPWHTTCVATGPDRPGALQAITAAFAAAGLVVHTARATSDHGAISDRFTISDRLGRKLEAGSEEQVCQVLRGERRRRRPWRRW